MTPLLGSRYEDALVYAARLHAAQVRKGTAVPYLAHLLAVSSLALEFGADEDQAVAALLHDAIEDAPEDVGVVRVRADILERFGPRVLGIVEGCTDADTHPKPPWRSRKEAYLEHLRGAPPAVKLVSASDKLHNARAIRRDLLELGGALWSRFSVHDPEEHLWYYRSLVEALRDGAPPALVRELEEVVADLERRVRGGELEAVAT